MDTPAEPAVIVNVFAPEVRPLRNINADDVESKSTC